MCEDCRQWDSITKLQKDERMAMHMDIIGRSVIAILKEFEREHKVIVKEVSFKRVKWGFEVYWEGGEDD